MLLQLLQSFFVVLLLELVAQNRSATLNDHQSAQVVLFLQLATVDAQFAVLVLSEQRLHLIIHPL